MDRHALTDPRTRFAPCDDSTDPCLAQEQGKVRDEEGFVAALCARDDIFTLGNDSALIASEALAVLAGVAVGLSLSLSAVDTTEQFPGTGRDHRSVRLLRAASPPPDTAQHPPWPPVARAQPVPWPGSVGGADHHPEEETVPATDPPERSEQRVFAPPDIGYEEREDDPDLGDGIGRKQVSERVWEAPSGTGRTVPELLARADTYRERRDLDAAFPLLRDVLEREPDNPRALWGMGDLFRYEGVLDSALHFYESSLRVDPHNPHVHTGLGTVRYHKSRLARNRQFVLRRGIADQERYIEEHYQGALEAYTRAITLDSSRVTPLVNRGVIRRMGGDVDGALEDYTLAITIDSGHANAFRRRGSLYRLRGDPEAALADYTRAIALDSSSYRYNPTLNYANSWFGRGVVYFEQGRYQEALADFDAALARFPRHRLARLNRSITLWHLERYQEALEGLTAVIASMGSTEYGGTLYLAYLHRGNTWKELGSCSKAVADYRRALESREHRSTAAWRIASCLAEHEPDSALHWLERSREYGFTNVERWRRNRDFIPLHDRREFRKLVGR